MAERRGERPIAATTVGPIHGPVTGPSPLSFPCEQTLHGTRGGGGDIPVRPPAIKLRKYEKRKYSLDGERATTFQRAVTNMWSAGENRRIFVKFQMPPPQ